MGNGSISFKASGSQSPKWRRYGRSLSCAMVPSCDTSCAEEGNNFMITPSHPSGQNNRQLFISLLVSGEELLREIKQALQLKHNKLLAQCWKGFPASLPCDEAVTSWLIGTRSVPFLYHDIVQRRIYLVWILLHSELRKGFLLHVSAPFLHFPMLCKSSGTFPFWTFFTFSFFYTGICFILHNRSWHIARSLVFLSPPIFLVEIWCFCRQECKLNGSRCSHYIMLFLQKSMRF